MKKIILIMLITVILTGCNGFPNGTISQPEGKVIVGGEQYTMMSGDYEWKEDNIEISTKSIPDINELAELFETIEVDKGDTLKFEVDKNPSSITVTKLNEDGTIIQSFFPVVISTAWNVSDLN
ncbi:membrane lipoprotein lipid attachment site-containing protein [Psychrobacillus sp. FSL H8-0484]|uniref:membrane lipoprotein lipid attachment site-containing protein n=1 Tax=Psychrobacillus sp. FSL H8-0484 TaxID=2921390 RepID=UPI0030FB724C